MARPGRPKNLYLITTKDGFKYIIECLISLDCLGGRRGTFAIAEGFNLSIRLIASDRGYRSFLSVKKFKKMESISVDRLPLYIDMKYKSIFFNKLLRDDF